MEFPEELFSKVWVLDGQGKIHKAKVVSAKDYCIEVRSDVFCIDGIQGFTTPDGKKWEYFDSILLFDLDSAESKQLIKDKVLKYSKKVKADYQKAFAEYHKCTSKITEIKQSNLKMMNEETCIIGYGNEGF